MEQYLVLGLQALWGLCLVLVTFTMRRLLTDLENNTAATKSVSDKLQELNLSLSARFVMKEDWDYIRDRVHSLGDLVHTIKAREDLREAILARDHRGGK